MRPPRVVLRIESSRRGPQAEIDIHSDAPGSRAGEDAPSARFGSLLKGLQPSLLQVPSLQECLVALNRLPTARALPRWDLSPL
jgi:hypothetical protein